MTPTERSSINNAIWLCSNCATEIDVAPSSYPTVLLHEWKRLAEEAARQEKGKPLPHPDDARNQLVSAMTGMPTSFVGAAIKNIHDASEQVLEGLDSRFRVETSYNNKITTYTVHALEEAQCTIQVPGQLAQDWQAALQALEDHGLDVTVPAAGVRMKGSPLLERMFTDVGLNSAHVSIGANKKPAAQKLKVLNPATGEIEQFDDVVGQVCIGRKSFTFQGYACGEVFSTSLNFTWEPKEKTDFTWLVNPELWCQRDIRYLPHFDKLFRLFERLVSGWEIDVELEIDGLQVLKANTTAPMSSKEVQSMASSLHYIALVRKIAAYLDVSIKLARDWQVSQAEYVRALEVVEIIEGQAVYGRSAIQSNATCHLVARDGASNIRLLLASESPCVITMQADDEGGLVAFGQAIQLPRMEILLEEVRPKIHHEDLATIQDGDAVLIEWEPAENFLCSLKYMISAYMQGRGLVQNSRT
jgi:hypothetical protein